MPPRPFPGFALLLALVLLCAAAKAVLYDTLDPDCFWHLRVGQQLAEQGVHPLYDTLSFASIRAPWTPYSWLAELGMWRLWDAGGFRAAVLAAALLNAATLFFVALASREAVRAARHPDVYLPPILATAFAALLTLPYLSFRPVTLAICLLSMIAWLIFRDRRLGERSAAVWLVPPITVLIVNVHLFAVIVPLWFASLTCGAAYARFIAARQDTSSTRPVGRYALLTFASALACLLTPMLPGLLATAAHYQFHDPMVAATVIGEMRPFYAGPAGKLSLGLVALFAACVIKRRDRLRPGEVCWLIVSSLLLVRLGRMTPLFALVAAPLFAVTLPDLSDAILARPLLRGAVGVILCLGVLRVAADFPGRSTELSAWLDRLGPTAPGYPTDAARFVAAHVPRDSGRLINEFNWGGYLAWRLGDGYQVFLDGRTQLFTPEFWRATYLGDEASRRAALAPLRADAAILPAEHSLFRPALIALGWHAVHRDARAEVLVPPTTDVAGLGAN